MSIASSFSRFRWYRSWLGVWLGLAMATSAATAAAEPVPRIEGAITMEQAVNLGLEHSRRIKISAADQKAMRSVQKESLSGFLPQVSVNGYWANQSMTPNIYNSAGDTMARNYQLFGINQALDLNITVMWSLFSGGRTFYGYKAAQARSDAATLMRAGTELDVAVQSRLDYITAVRERENAQVTGELMRQTEERLRVTREEFAAGRVPRLNVLRDEAELANVIQMDTVARNRVELALIALKTTLGVDLASPITLGEGLEYRRIAVAVPEATAQALSDHPEVRSAERQTRAAEMEKRAAYGRYLPELQAVLMYDWQRMRNWGDEMTDTLQGYSAGLVLTIPLFDGFMRENAIGTARARQEKALEQQALAGQQVAKEVSQAALLLDASEKSIEAARRGLSLAEEQFRVAQERFASGRGIQLEILDAQATLTRSRFNIVSALAEHETARAMWLRATGRVR
jgi:outer membrane protein TolC